jgi:hypothetical protein
LALIAKHKVYPDPVVHRFEPMARSEDLAGRPTPNRQKLAFRLGLLRRGYEAADPKAGICDAAKD